MSRRVSLPGAAELFRPTHAKDEEPSRAGSDPAGLDSNGTDSNGSESPVSDVGTSERAAPEAARTKARTAPRGGSGRVRHDEKITVYVSGDELLALERARLTLRAEHAMAVDRGRIVREALALILADLAAEGADSALVRRLSQS